MAGYRVVHRLEIDPVAERRALVAGLRATPPRIPPKYFYDDLGSALYGAICALPEYYPTRTEGAIFSAYRAEIAQAIGTGGQFVDLGAGDCSKGESWLPFVAAKRYVALSQPYVDAIFCSSASARSCSDNSSRSRMIDSLEGSASSASFSAFFFSISRLTP